MGEFFEGVFDVAMYAVPILLFVWVLRYLIEMSRERRRLRMEVAKLAHEVETLRVKQHAGAKTAEKTPV